MKKKIKLTIATSMVLLSMPIFISAQVQNIEIRFLNAKFTDTTSGKDLVAVFLVSTRDSAGFPPTVNLPPKCTVFENGREKVVLLTPQMLSVTFNGEDVDQKYPEIYQMIKGMVDLNAMKTSMIVTYAIKDIFYDFRKMALTPAFTEKKNKSARIEKRSEFIVN